MQLLSNEIMNGYLRQIEGGFEGAKFNLPDAIKAVVYSPFEESNDCITLKELNDYNPPIATDEDKCWWEYNETNFHPDWFDSDDDLDYLRAAIVSGRTIARRLGLEYPERHFKIIITYLPTAPNDPDGIPTSSTVRFYQTRNNINLLADLEGHSLTATIEINI